jgi:DNA polymerase
MGAATYKEIPYRGPKSGVDIVVVGESPGGYELYAGKPFVGDSGAAVNAELKANGIDPGTVFFANACRCMLMKDDKTAAKVLKEALTSCRPALVQALKYLKPKLIVCFGDVALQQVLGQKGITKKRGRVVRSGEFDCLVLPTFHPAACFRDQGKFAFWRPDMALVGRLARTGFVLEDKSTAGIYKDVESIDFLLTQSDFTAALDTETQGTDWCNANSIVLSYSVTIC